MCYFHKKRTWINSSVIVSAKITSYTSTGTTLSMLKIYSRYLIRILKVKYTEFKFSYFTIVSSAQWPAGLPAIGPGSTTARAPVFSHNEGNCVGFTKLLFRRKFIHSQICFLLSFIS